jgi:hypothetical protein
MNAQTMTSSPPVTTIDQWVFRIAGLFVLLSVLLSQLHSIQWLWFTAFVGANMLQASFTGFCPIAMILKKLGVKSGAAFCAVAGTG